MMSEEQLRARLREIEALFAGAATPAILDRRQPTGLRLTEILRNGPAAWEEQRMSWVLAG